MPSELRISAIIPVYNAATRVARAVESALSQPEVAEVILVEDGSPDDALRVCQRIEAENPEVRLYRHPGGENRGAGASRNLGVANAACPIVAFLDADDWWLPERFKAECSLFASDPSIDGVYGAIRHQFANDQIRAAWNAQGRAELLTVSAPVPPDELVFVLLWAHPAIRGEFSTIAVTVRRDFFLRVGGFHPALRLQQDTHLWKRMAAAGRLVSGSIVEPVAVQDVHGNNRMTRQGDHEAYLDLWWSSLADAFRDLRVRPPVMQAWRRGYATYRGKRGPRWKAVLALANWVLRQPSELGVAYGHFDLTLRSIFGASKGVDRILSAKNRLTAQGRSAQ